MSATKFTKGPWEIEYDNADDGSSCWYSVGPANVHFPYSAPDLEDEAKANAHLIAASPDMFEQLADLRHYIASDKLRFSENANAQHRQIIDRIDSALSKARGESQ